MGTSGSKPCPEKCGRQCAKAAGMCQKCRFAKRAANSKTYSCSKCGGHRNARSTSGMCESCFVLSGGRAGSSVKQADLSVTEKGDSLVIDSLSYSVTTVPEAILKSGIDLRIWDVVKSSARFYQSPNREGTRQLVAVAVEMRRKVPTLITDAVADLIDSLKIAPAVTIHKRIMRGDHVAELSITDHHFGKLAWAAETGEDYDLNIAVGRWKKAVGEAIETAQRWDIKSWVFPIGNDLLHVDNIHMETSKGTPQDCDGRWPKIYSTAVDTVLWSVELMRQVAPVHIIWVPGNHDTVSSWFVVQVLKARYSKAKDITIDDGPSPHKYVELGATLLGYTHGDEIKHDSLPAIMATSQPAAWARTKHHEWHVGHTHKRKETRWVNTDSHTGVVVRVLPSLCGTDSWHYKRGYIDGPTKAGEMYLYDEKKGYRGHIAVGHC